MPLEVVLFRDKKDGNSDLVRLSLRRRGLGDALVDDLIASDSEWAVAEKVLDSTNHRLNILMQEICRRRKYQIAHDDLSKEVRELKLRRIQEKQVATQLMQARDNILHAIPNIVHASVPVVSPVPLLASRLGRERSCGSELSSKSEDHTRNCLLLLRQYYTSAMTNENAGLVDGNGGGESVFCQVLSRYKNTFVSHSQLPQTFLVNVSDDILGQPTATFEVAILSEESRCWSDYNDLVSRCECLLKGLGLTVKSVCASASELNLESSKLVVWFAEGMAENDLPIAEIVNFTDYKTREMGIRRGHKTKNQPLKEYAHLMGGILCCPIAAVAALRHKYGSVDKVEDHLKKVVNNT